MKRFKDIHEFIIYAMKHKYCYERTTKKNCKPLLHYSVHMLMRLIGEGALKYKESENGG